MRRRRNSKSALLDDVGGSAVEFALIAPIFILTLVGLTEVGFAIHAHATLTQIAEGGARHLLFAPEDRSGATTQIFADTKGTTITAEDLTVALTEKSAPYPHLEVTLSYIFRPVGPFPLPSGIPMVARASVPLGGT
ncbi:TadE family protein [Devosia sp. MC521]|uniref:TadE family protein n=1 Tax=Devosia sp. MC521 TaxID=2759954 RepID=UPI0015F7F2A3|nr:TadE family protein [Devosia sp. MC521]MBJ6988892.1 pilus assembly protein [Devosia sp. MC521]QMW62242.1 pilus assembly protein [Devosia sp. MC521]